MRSLSSSAPIIQLIGPTATGKTQLALALAEIFPIEIVSVDSALVYREMDIGTAKPTLAERQKVPHHLINICAPNEAYSVGLFLRDVAASIRDIHGRHKIPLLVGGTMLYFNALNKGLADIPTVPTSIRLALQNTLAEKGLAFLYERLKKVDAVSAARVHPNDAQRVLRALEVFEATEKPLSAWHAQQHVQVENHALTLLLMPEDRQILHQHIAGRFHKMIVDGLIEEVDLLVKKYALTDSMSSMRSVGYRQVLQYLQNKITDEEMIQQGVYATRQLAKRQMTWLRTWPTGQLVEPYHSDTIQLLKNRIESYLAS